MLTPQAIKSLSLLLLAGGALAAFNPFSPARGADGVEVAAASPNSPMAAQSLALPNCASANYDGTRRLYTIINGAPRVARATGEPLDAKGAVLEAKNMPVNQQCVLHVVPAGAAAAAGEMPAGRYTVYYSGGGDGGAGGTARFNGGGGGGASAVQDLITVNLVPGNYKLTLGAGGPGGVACKDMLGGGPGYPGSPTGLTALNNGIIVAGTADADTWKRPSRSQLEKMIGNKDGHGGTGPGRAPGGNGGFNTPARAFGASEGGANPAPWVAGTPGDNGTGVLPVVATGIGAGGGGGAGLGNGGEGAGLIAPKRAQTIDTLPEMGGLGAGGGGGQGRETFCTAGAAGGPGYMAFRRS